MKLLLFVSTCIAISSATFIPKCKTENASLPRHMTALTLKLILWRSSTTSRQLLLAQS